jgi:PE family
LVPTTGVLAAGADEVSATIATLFGAHAKAYQALSAQAAVFHNPFVQLMSAGAGQYAAAEAANASPLQTLQQDLLTPPGRIDAVSRCESYRDSHLNLGVSAAHGEPRIRP